jgi:thiol-disulfide isomerase/thioredoxin
MGVIPAVVWKRALFGAVQGVCLVGVGLIAYNLMRGVGPLQPWPGGPAMVVLAGCVFALGRALAEGLMGACVGALTGLALGLAVSSPFKVPAEQTGFSLAGPTLDGKEFDLEQYRGKVVLVDFWATWCGPCREELPNIAALYKRYHDDGLEVVGVNLDHNRDALAQFVKRNKLPWPQIYFEEQDKPGGTSPLAAKHEVRLIPETFLISRDGVAVRGLHGAALEKSVKALMSGKRAETPMRPNPHVLAVALVVGCLAGALAGALIERRMGQYTPRPRSAPAVGGPPPRG